MATAAGERASEIRTRGDMLAPMIHRSSWPGLTRPSTRALFEENMDAREKPGHVGWTYAAFGRAALARALDQSSQCVSASTSARSTVAPHQMRKPAGASR